MVVFGEQTQNQVSSFLFQPFTCKESQLMPLTLTAELSSNCSLYSLPAQLIAKDSQLGVDTSAPTCSKRAGWVLWENTIPNKWKFLTLHLLIFTDFFFNHSAKSYSMYTALSGTTNYNVLSCYWLIHIMLPIFFLACPLNEWRRSLRTGWQRRFKAMQCFKEYKMYHVFIRI